MIKTMLAPNHICSHCCPEGRPLRAEKSRVLYVGADPESLVALRHGLGEDELLVVGCSDRGGAAMFLKSEIEYHLLVFDAEWQGAEGLKLAKLAHSLRHRKQTPTILVGASESTGASARRFGTKEFVVKTEDMVSVTQAIKRLQRLLESRELNPN